MRVLFITSVNRTAGWLADALASDRASEVILEEAVGVPAGMSQLRDDTFDAVLIGHEPPELNALELLDAVRTGSSQQQPIIVMGTQSEQELTALCFEAGADAYVSVHTTTTRTLIWHVARAAERHRLIVENRRLRHARRHRLQLEQDEVKRLLSQQRALIHASLASDVASDRGEDDSAPPERNDSHSPLTKLPKALLDHYRELLRAYVIMGSGNLSEEMHRLVELLVTAEVSARQAMRLHLHALEEMICDLGSRSARHVMNRADLLALEVMINLAEGYCSETALGAEPPRLMHPELDASGTVA